MRDEADNQYRADNAEDDPGIVAATLHSSFPATEPSYKKADAQAKIADSNKKRECVAHVADGSKTNIDF